METYVTIRGKVIDDSGKPVEGAVLNCYGSAWVDSEDASVYKSGIRTGRDGGYEFQMPSGPERFYAYVVAYQQNHWTNVSVEGRTVSLPKFVRARVSIPYLGEDVIIEDIRLNSARGWLIMEIYDFTTNKRLNTSFTDFAFARFLCSNYTVMFHSTHHPLFFIKDIGGYVLALPGNVSMFVDLFMNSPDMGAVYLPADNDGMGFSTPEGNVKTIVYNYETARTLLREVEEDLLFAKSRGFINKTMDEELASAKHFIDVAAKALESGDKGRCVAYANQALGFLLKVRYALLKPMAELTAERHLENATIRVYDEFGRPIKGAEVSYTQTRNSFFKFGFQHTSAYISLYPTPPYYKVDLPLEAAVQIGLDLVQPQSAIIWQAIEGSSGEYSFDKLDRFVDRVLDEYGLDLQARITFAWKYPDRLPPSWVNWENVTQRNEAFAKFCRTLAQRYKGKITVWQIMNEANANLAFHYGFYSSQREPWSELASFIRAGALAIKSVDPNNLIMTSMACITTLPHTAIDEFNYFKTLLDYGAPLDILGVDLYGPSYPDPTYLTAIVKRLKTLGKPIILQEFGYESSPSPVKWYYNGGWGDQGQSNYVRDILYVAISEKCMGALLWSIGASSTPSDLDVAYYEGAKLVFKPAYYTYGDVVRQFRSCGSTITDEEGRLTVKVFSGSYVVNVKASGYEPMNVTINVVERANNTYVITLATEAHSLINEVKNKIEKAEDVGFRFKEAQILLEKAADEYGLAVQNLQTGDYEAASEHAKRAGSLIKEAYEAESKYTYALVFGVIISVTAVGLAYLLRRNRLRRMRPK